MQHRYRVALVLLVFLLAACQPAPANAPLTETPAPPAPPTATVTSTPVPLGLWIGPSVPDDLRQQAGTWGIPAASDSETASLHLDLQPAPTADGPTAAWVYALVAPFPTVTDGVTADELRQAWNGQPPDAFVGSPLLMTESTLATFTGLWGEPASGAVKTLPADQLVDAAWADRPSWGIVPFETIQPRWKVLTVDGQSPIRKDFDAASYPLVASYALTCNDPCPLSSLPELTAANRDPSKLSTVIMTGVTALVRATAFTIDRTSVTEPGSAIRDWLRQADITHISNEVPFYDRCPPPNPNYLGYIFCSSPRYIGLFEDVGADVIELTGDHFDNYGVDGMLQTLEIYRQHDMGYYGGGADVNDAIKPLLVESNGNKFAFIGCNAKGDRFYPKASDTRPGPAPCLRKYMTEQIASLKAQGYLPIVTFQHEEYYSPDVRPGQQQDFRMMADAGAVVVSGSQAHFPQMMEFYDGAFIHYGLGNLFFDQMYYTYPDGRVTTLTRREFIDRHVFYDGRYLGVELLTARLADYAKPIPMDPTDRAGFLIDYFNASGWGPYPPTPTPTVTPTLPPLPTPAGTGATVTPEP